MRNTMRWLIISGLAVTLTIPLIKAQLPGKKKLEMATFAGGCFWCMQPPFENLNGVLEVYAGYTGGTGQSPNYGDYAQKGYLEAVRITYDPAKISYQELLDVFWRQIDPTDPGGQFVDRGPQYRSAIFYENEEQKRLAEKSKEELGKSGRYGKPLVTDILKAASFYKAEAYHQDYAKKNPSNYHAYRDHSGRDQFLRKIWGDPHSPKNAPAPNAEHRKYSKEELKKMLTPIQYQVTQENGTETPFHNEYWNNERAGIYVDIVSGDPLFSSLDKFDSGTGWPSFTKPLEPQNIAERTDGSLSMLRTEVRGRRSGSHLGHVFDDGPPPTGLRYCMNSAALRFIPREDLEKSGYGKYERLFKR